MTTTTAPAVTITPATFRRMIGDMIAAHDVAASGMWVDPGAIADEFTDRLRTVLDLVDHDAFFGPAADIDGLAGEVAAILDDGPNGPGIAPDPVAMVAAVRDAIGRGTADDLADDDRCAAHGAGPVRLMSHVGFAGPVYVTRYACGCDDVDASADVPER